MPSNLTQAEFWWLVGILEGEGSFAFQSGSQRVFLQMTDEDTMVRVANIYFKIIGKAPYIAIRDKVNLKHNSTYEIILHGQSARDIMLMIVPHMSARRRQRIWQSLNRYKYKPAKTDVTEIISYIKARKSA